MKNETEKTFNNVDEELTIGQKNQDDIDKILED